MRERTEEAAYATFVYAQIAVSDAAGAADVEHAAIIFAGTHCDVYIIFENKRYAISGLRAVVVGIGRA